MPKISVIIITFNEERYIEQCILSVAKIADEIVVLDSFSTDKTPEICNKLGVRFIQQPFLGYQEQKNFAVKLASFDYILSLDADEALSIEMEKSILQVKQNWKFDGYRFNRLNFCCGRWMYHTNWYPDSRIRLFDRRKGAWGGINPHDIFILNPGATVKHLKGNILHYAYNSYDQLINAMNQYSALSAKEYFKKGEKASFLKLVLNPSWRFFHSYILKRGFMDGYQGFFVSISIAKLSQLKYIKLKQLYLDSRSELVHQHPSLAKTGLRIGFDAKRTYYNRSGLGNYSRNLIVSLVKLNPNDSFNNFTPKTKKRIILDTHTEENTNIITPSKLYYKAVKSIWRSRFIVNDIKKNKIDIYHGLSHELPYGINKSGAKSIVTIHDLIFLRFPKFYGPVNVFIYKKKMEYACRVADKIIAISAQTKEDLINFLNVDPNKIEVIYQSCNVAYQRKSTQEEFQNVKSKYTLPDKYLLYVGTIEERKNLLNILMALKEKKINIPLVVIGRKAEYFHKIIKPYLADNKIDSIIFPEKVMNEELPIIYQNALCFVYPSIFEGFGIPILEAIVSGIPVITSKGSCFEETGGPGSIYVDPYNPSEIGGAIQRVIENQELRSAMVAKGVEHAKLFTPEKIADDYMKMYKSLLKS